MGRKQNAAQRTKGNLKPSSSAKAAELLENSGSSSGKFLGFGLLGSAAQDADEVDSSLDSDFAMVMKKMTKKDALTKLKAAQEFSRLCKEKDADAVGSVLQYWPKIFSKLTIDYDCRVREATNEAFEQLVLRVRRNLAPHLKSVMGPWLVAQCDVYAPAASAAKSAFSSAFSVDKQADAIGFCRTEILAYIEDILLKQSPCDAKTQTDEFDEAASRHIQMLGSALEALSLLVSHLSSAHLEALQDSFQQVLKNQKFWKFGKHPAGPVRAGLYCMVARLAEFHPNIVNQFADQICPTVLYSLDEDDPGVTHALWIAVLQTISVIPDWWSKINLKKGLYPKLWTLLKNGGFGCAVVSYPNLLPFLSLLPLNTPEDRLWFYDRFFNEMKNGLTVQQVCQSQSELNAVTKAFVECVQFCVKQGLTNGDQSLVRYLTLEQIVPMFEASIAESRSALSRSGLYDDIVGLLSFLQRSSESSGVEKSEKHVIAEFVFDQVMKELSQRILDNIKENNDEHLDRVVKFLEAFSAKKLSKKDVDRKSKKAVKFSEESQANAELDAQDERLDKNDAVAIENVDSPVFSSASHFRLKPTKIFTDLISEACLQSAVLAKEKKNQHVLGFFSRTFKAFASRELTCFLMEKLDQCDTTTEGDQVASFIRSFLMPWMLEVDSSSSDAEAARYLIEAATVAWNLLDDAKKLEMLSCLIQNVGDRDVLYRLLLNFISSEANGNVRKWVGGAEFGEFLFSVAQDLCRQSSEAGEGEITDRSGKWSLLCFGLSSEKNGEPVLGETYITRLLAVIHSALPPRLEANDSSVSQCISFVCDVASQFLSNMQDCLSLPSFEDLLLSIFQLGLQPPFLSAAVSQKLHATSEKGISVIVARTGFSLDDGSFLSKAVTCLSDVVRNNVKTVERIRQLVDVTCRLRRVVLELCPAEDEALLKRLCYGFTALDVSHWKAALIVRGDMLFTCDDLVKAEPLTLDVVPDCVVPVAFTCLLLAEISTPSGKPTSGVGLVSGSEGHRLNTEASELGNLNSDDVVVDDKLKFHVKNPDVIQDVALGLAFCQAVTKHRSSCRPTSELFLVTSLLEKNFSALTGDLSEELLRILIRESFDKSLKNGHLWSLALQLPLRRLQEMHCDYRNAVGGVDSIPSLTPSVVATLCSAMPCFEAEDMVQLMNLCLAQIISYVQDNIVEHLDSLVLSLACFNKAFSLQSTEKVTTAPADTFFTVFAQILELRDRFESLFLFNTTVSAETWQLASFNIEAMRLFTLAVNKLPTVLSSSQWDTILCSTVSWIQSISEAQGDLLDDLMTLTFTSAACDLLQAIAVCMQFIVPEQPTFFPPNLLSEWKELFSSTAYDALLPVFVDVSGKIYTTTDIEPEVEVMLRRLCSVVAQCPAKLLLEHKLSAKLVADVDSNLPDSLQTLLNYFCPLLLSCHQSIQTTAYRVLLKLIPELPKYDEKSVVPDGENGDIESSRCPATAIINILELAYAEMRHLFSDVGFGEMISVDPFSLDFSSATAYLLGWNLLLQFFRLSTSELRVEYAQWISDHGIVDILLQTVFSLMPQNPVITLKDNLVTNDMSKKLASSRNMFAEDPSLDIRILDGSQWTSHLQHIVCTVYRRALETLPAVVRQWWNKQDKRISGIVEKFTAKHVSPLLCVKELQTIQESNGSLEGVTIKVRPVTREVVATYALEETSTELIITLPANMPFGNVSVDCGNRIGVTKPQWRNWMLQLVVFLSFQNGSILDALAMWKRNIDKRFEGVEDCMVCFSVIHGSNYQLPKLQCRTCKKRFHSTCLYKWFKTSSNSACPLCRNIF